MFARVCVTVLATVLASGATAALAAPPTLPSAFGMREALTGVTLSPDGTKIAYLVPRPTQGNALMTVSLAGNEAPKTAAVASGNPERLNRCGWVSSARLVCTVYTLRRESGFLVAMTRMIAVNADGTEIKVLNQQHSDDAWYFNRYGGDVIDWLPGQDDAVLLSRWYVPETRAGTLIEKRDEGLGVERVDTRSLSTRKVVTPLGNASEYISDGQGNVRVMGTEKFTGDYVRTGVTHYLYRPKGSSSWQDFGDYNESTESGFNPIAVDPVEDVAYGLRKKDGRWALYKRTLNDAQTETLVFAHPEVDVDGVIRLGRKHRIVGAAYTTDRGEAHYFDPALVRLANSLSKALPGEPLITFEGASDDEQKLLIWAGSDTDPGKYYLLDRATKQMRPLMLSRPELDGVKLAAVQSVSVKVSDGSIIPGYLTLPAGSSAKGLPALVMPHGGPSSRDTWGFDWLAQYFAAQGYAVLQPNYRGSSGYGDSWFRNQGFKAWQVAIGDVVDSGRWLIAQGIADPAKLGIFGWSYGGYAALQSGVVAPDLFKAIVAVAPVTDLAELKRQYTNSTAQRMVRDFIGVGPHITAGSPAQNAGAIKAPIMLFHGDLDRNVDVVESKMMADKLKGAGKPVEITLYPGLDHYLEDSSVRADMLGKSDAFLKANLGIK
jgi:dipeptidyl aminopeptidase/acylaminoacyl peptidase